MQGLDATFFPVAQLGGIEVIELFLVRDLLLQLSGEVNQKATFEVVKGVVGQMAVVVFKSGWCPFVFIPPVDFPLVVPGKIP